MFLHVYTLFSIDDRGAEQRLINSLRIEGEWQARARCIAPQLIASDLPAAAGRSGSLVSVSGPLDNS